MSESEQLLAPGRNCWRIEHAQRLAMIVDAADYFRYAKAAMLEARHSILLIGWDFDMRIQFEPEGQRLDGPNRLGEFLCWLPKQRPDLRVYVLKWDLGVIQAVGQVAAPRFLFGWLTTGRLRFKLDGAHPLSAAHHQKIVVLDDAVAFCGGIDMTADRWDTQEHRDNDPRRVTPGGEAYGPWHDAIQAVDGAAARALGDLARDRWLHATGESLAPAPRELSCWPGGLEATVTDVKVGIARSAPENADRPPVREVEALYLDAIARARRVLYFETQYLASRKLAEAMAQRLRESDGPEIVIVLPKSTEGWLERKAMDGARAKLLHLLWDADRHGRLGAYYPVTEAGQPIYVHAKVTVVDDWLLRVGSSNLNNRSMGFDTECDLAVEAEAGADDLCATILGIRRRLLCEHLDANAADFDVALEKASGSLVGAIDALRSAGRTLQRFSPADVENEHSALAENELMDPERRPESWSERFGKSLQRVARKLAPG